ncbi:hypothetical protein GCM10025857_25780 [Alicyclobacillus contaminans]|uniref:hypothetical protein n=1 Tax=Alicyclobacillus contaminans TaxID=392016 RepID=UPI00040F80CA|nr:hypothetical protein [Alicyclobacillus contaminans]GMA51221.1 hypothetical protein GCM10025857_25780 [Alicyclobacillus contaminans]
MSDMSALLPALSCVLGHLEASIYAEQVFCSVVTEMETLPMFQDQPLVASIHRENYETSYHRNTAAGHLQRSLANSGVNIHQLMVLTVECLYETRAHDLKAETYLRQLDQINHEDAAGWMAAAVKWHRRRKRQLNLAARTLHSVLPSPLWAEGARRASGHHSGSGKSMARNSSGSKGLPSA